MASNNSSQHVTLKERFGFLLANIGNIPLMILLSTYFLIFYTDVVGLNSAAIATLFLISKIVDGISDPIMGFILDRFPMTKHGKFRPLLMIGTVICVINYILLWFGAVWSPVAKYVIVYVTYLLLGLTFDVMDISLNSLLPCMTTDNKERNTLSAIKGFGYMAGIMAISILAPLIVADGTLASYYRLIFGFMVVVLVGSIVGALFIKERVEFKQDDSGEEKYGIKQLFKFIFVQPVFVTFLANLVGQSLTGVASGAATYFYTYVLGNLALYSIVSIVSSVVMFPAMIAAPAITNRLGKKKLYVGCALICAFALLIRLIAPTSMPLLYFSTVLTGVAGGISMTLGYGIQADNTTYVQYTTGKHAEAAIASLSSFITKCAQGIAGAIPGYILALTGYIANAETQTSGAINGILACVIIIPAIGYLFMAIVFGKFYPLDQKKVNEMSEEIAKREA